MAPRWNDQSYGWLEQHSPAGVNPQTSRQPCPQCAARARQVADLQDRQQLALVGGGLLLLLLLLFMAS